MASLNEDNINFEKLAAGADQAIAAENLYWLQNDAKFRAVKQKGTYDEFREIVAAAHLKPLDKRDKLQITDEKPVGPWNPITAKNSAVATQPASQATALDKQTLTLPSTSNEFIRCWRNLKTSTERLDYLKGFTSDQLHCLFKCEIPFGLMGEFLTVLNSSNQDGSDLDLQWTHEVLLRLADTGRFNITLSFLAESERSNLSAIVLHMVQAGINVDDIQSLYKLDFNQQ